MKSFACRSTEALLAAARAGATTPEQLRHTAGCAACAAALQLDRELAALAGLLAAHASPVSADAIEHRAARRRRLLAAERADRLLSRLRTVGLGAVTLVGGVTLFATRGLWSDWLLRPLLARPPAPMSGDTLTVAAAVLAGSVLAVWLLQQWAEE